MRLRIFFSLVVILSFVLSFGLCRHYWKEGKALRAEVRALELRLADAIEHPDTFYIHDTIPVYRTKVVEVDKTDYKKHLADLETIKELGLKVGELESENRTLLSTRDTIVLRAENDSVVSYRDEWNVFSYCFSSGVLDWEVRDSLSTYVSRAYKHKFLWWKWGVKGYNVSIVSHNPRCRVLYDKFLKIK